MRFKHTRTFAAVAMAVAAMAATTAGAARPEAVADGSRLITPAWMPLGVGNGDVTVVIQLSGDPVTIQQANAGRKLTRPERDQAKSSLRSSQNALNASIASLGGTILANFQVAYNGIKVRIGRDKLAQLATLPGVIGVRPVTIARPDNTHGVPLIGAPGVWQSLGLHGEHIKIAIIDTGIDYTHANFGGPGTAAAYAAAHANETAPADPTLFGPNAPRVKGGTDLVGDSYDADPNSDTYQPTPHPDPNPLDCNGHGSHVAGTAAGSGVTAAGNQYTGTYNATTISNNTWNVGPGVAPKADIYAVRVFGCNGSTDVVVDAIEWATDNDMDVINMSLGSDFGTNDTPDAEAASNAVKSGVVVVTSAGNAGPNPYMVGSPSTADGAISVAAIDPLQIVAGLRVQTTPPSGTPLDLQAINANGSTLGLPLTNRPLVILTDDPTTTADLSGFVGSADESLGCSPGAFTHAGIVPGGNQIAVVKRGTCARVAKAIFGQQAGAAAVLMLNNGAGLPPFEGNITSNPDTGMAYTVTIPFGGIAGSSGTAGTDSAKLQASPADTTATLSVQDFANPGFESFASFSSAGPRSGDSGAKPDLSAPGVSIMSTASGTGNLGEILSGTSMASPHVAGSAVLTVQGHPTWRADDVRAALVNTGLPSGVTNYSTRGGGTGLVQPASAIASQVVAHGDGVQGTRFEVSLNFGFDEMDGDFKDSLSIHLDNNGTSVATFRIAPAIQTGSPHTVSFDKSVVTIPPRGHADVRVTLSVPAATAGASNEGGLSFHDVAGLVQLTPVTSHDNANVTLRVPYYFVPRPRSNVSTKIGDLKGANPSTTATVTNKKGAAIAGDADFYAWGLEDKNEKGNGSNDVRAVGVQSFSYPSGADPDRQLMVFAINTYSRWSNASVNEFDVLVDVDGDGTPDYVIVGADQGNVQTGVNTGVVGSFVFSTRSGGASIAFLATAPTDSSTLELPVLSSQLCRSGEPCLNKTSNPRITYQVQSFDLVNGGSDTVPGSAIFNVWNNAISTGGFAGAVPPGGTDTSNVISVNSAEWALSPALGLMVVTLDNKSGQSEAQLIDVKIKTQKQPK
ncbi:MAG TPA: S8 family serine peptidase [Casimicrobiaceae bacterium]|nr:S8 family serine peptidase [Casimicrobiaceae bacterium]